MKRAVLLLMSAVMVSLLGYLGVEAFIPVATTPEPPQTEAQLGSAPFPIVTRFEIARDYGYFIGDVIPLTLVVEARQGVVVDLVNLPHQGEQHGLFEVRDVTITPSAQADGTTIYRAAYHLQYFGAAPLSTAFEPLEILYALASNRDAATQVYKYKSLFSQPVHINISRIGPYRPTKALDPKGPLPDRRLALCWGPSILGALCLMAAVGGWGQAWWRGRRPPTRVSDTLAEDALQRLRQHATVLTADENHRVAVATQLGHIMRDYLQSAWGVAAHALTPTELAARLQGKSQVHDILGLLQRCDAYKYEPALTAENAVQFLWEEAVTLFEHLD